MRHTIGNYNSGVAWSKWQRELSIPLFAGGGMVGSATSTPIKCGHPEYIVTKRYCGASSR